MKNPPAHSITVWLEVLPSEDPCHPRYVLCVRSTEGYHETTIHADQIKNALANTLRACDAKHTRKQVYAEKRKPSRISSVDIDDLLRGLDL